MDYASDQVLRLAAKFADHVYRLGYCWAESCCSRRGYYVPSFWEENVRVHKVDNAMYSTVLFRTLRRGKHRLLLWPDQEADASVNSTTPSKLGSRDEMGRLEKVRYRHAEMNASMICFASWSRSMNAVIYQSRIGWINWPFGRWKRFTQ
jgi:hypothetical protein